MALPAGRGTQAAPAGSARSFPECRPSPTLRSASSAPGHEGGEQRPTHKTDLRLQPPMAPPSCHEPSSGRAVVLGGWLLRACPAEAWPWDPPRLFLGQKHCPPSRPRALHLCFPVHRAATNPGELTSLPSRGRMSPLSWLRLSLMRARLRFSSSGFRVCGCRLSAAAAVRWVAVLDPSRLLSPVPSPYPLPCAVLPHSLPGEAVPYSQESGCRCGSRAREELRRQEEQGQRLGAKSGARPEPAPRRCAAPAAGFK